MWPFQLSYGRFLNKTAAMPFGTAFLFIRRENSPQYQNNYEDAAEDQSRPDARKPGAKQLRKD